MRGAAELRVKESDRIARAGRRVPRARQRGRGTSRRVRDQARRSRGRATRWRRGRRDGRSPAGDGICHGGARRRRRPSTIDGVGGRRRFRIRGSSRRCTGSSPPDGRVKADKVYLVGFMAAGKTTVARALARRLGLARRRHRRDDRAARAADGRRRSSRAAARPTSARSSAPSCSSICGPRHLVVATGGGTFVDPPNRAAINADGVSVWLDVPLERLIERVPADGRRPLAADRVGVRAPVSSTPRRPTSRRTSGWTPVAPASRRSSRS